MTLEDTNYYPSEIFTCELCTQFFIKSRKVFFPYKQHHIPYIRPHTSECGNALLIVHTESVMIVGGTENDLAVASNGPRDRRQQPIPKTTAAAHRREPWTDNLNERATKRHENRLCRPSTCLQTIPNRKKYNIQSI